VIEDPLMIWPGGLPYRVLADVGITPRSPQADIEEAAFTLMAEGLMNPATQQAWRQLRDVPSRLLVDLLFYDLDQDADIGRLLGEISEELVKPTELSEALTTLPVELLAGLADELAAIPVEPPAPPAVPVDMCAFPTPSFLDGLIRFDR
jgi:hypothetical protein